MRILGETTNKVVIGISCDKVKQLKTLGDTKQLCIGFNNSDRALDECLDPADVNIHNRSQFTFFSRELLYWHFAK